MPGNILWCTENGVLPGIGLSFILVPIMGRCLAQQSCERDTVSPSLLRLHEHLHHPKPGGITHRLQVDLVVNYLVVAGVGKCRQTTRLPVYLNSWWVGLIFPMASPSHNHPGKRAAESRAFRKPGQKHLGFPL